MRKLLAPAAGALICLAVLLTALPSLASLDGGGPGGANFMAELNLQDDPCGHDIFIWDSDAPHNLALSVVADGPEISVLGPKGSPWVDVHGEFVKGDQFIATGTGQVGPNSEATVELEGNWNGSVLTGKYTMGAGPNELPTGGCPDGMHHPAVYTIKPKATPTPGPTATPTEEAKTYSVVVLKLDNDTLLPLEGWKFNLYAGSNCQGASLDSQTTDEDGLAFFDGLDAGSYSVDEKPQDGWNAVTDVCQDANPATAGAVGGTPPCPIQPDEPFPQPGCDTFTSGARVNVRINATDETNSVSLNGPTQVVRENKPTDLDGDGLDEVKTEIVFMALTGGGIDVTESPTLASRGLIEEQQNLVSGTLEFPANSYFDVFFQVDLGGVTLHNAEPFHVECKIAAIPPYECLYQPDIPEPIELLNDDGVKIAKLLHGLHIPVPPKAALVVFANEQKPTPTPTPTTQPGVPTATPGAGPTATPTLPPGGPTATPTGAPPTPTATPLGKALGDVNDDGTVNSLDALLILQYSAGLLVELPNPESADVNNDGGINSVDAQLILQFDAGLLDRFPPPGHSGLGLRLP